VEGSLRRARGSKAAPWNPAATSEETRAYVQQRLALFCKLMFWTWWLVLGFVIAMYEQYPTTRPQRADLVHALAAIGLVLLGGIYWTMLRKRKTSIDALYRIDAVVTGGISAAFAMSAYFSPDERAAVYSALVWTALFIFARAVIVPSSPRRTAVVSALACIPLVLAGIGMAVRFPELLELPPPAFITGDIFHAAIVTLLATTTSRLFYGLRKQVDEAMQLGQYTLDEKIGEGGMGAVYRARHAMLRRPTAIKLLPPDKLGADSLRRFEREVQHMSQLTHPNTVAVYDYGRSPDGVFYYAMEFLDGIDLETLIKLEGPQPAPRVVHILRQVCGALDEAHGLGLIHRDIKPANVLLCRRGNQPDVAKVVDFGLVKEITRETEDHRTQVILGTPAYLAPEAVTDPERVAASSDLYSLGAVGYFLLTGQRVFDGKTLVDVCVQHVKTSPRPPSSRTDNAIPTDLEALIMKCLSKSPDDRPASARELRTLLAALPVYREWDEASALSWWDSWEERRAAVREAQSDPGVASPGTITVDIKERTGQIVPGDVQPRSIGQARK
jgi:serine/threonine-protein kinase